MADPVEDEQNCRCGHIPVVGKHGALMNESLFLSVFEREKQRTIAIEGELVQARGSLSRIEQEVARLERDKQSLIAQIGTLSERINETMMRISHLEGANDGAGQFRDLSPANPAFCGRWNVARGLAGDDFDGDGAPDLLVTTIGSRAISSPRAAISCTTRCCASRSRAATRRSRRRTPGAGNRWR